MQEFAYELKIPKERIAVLIGKEGKIKKEIEETTHTSIRIDSNDGDVFVTGEDALSLYVTRDIIRAVGRGINPEVALLLLKQDYLYEQINMTDFSKKTNHLVRLKGRIIGKNGRSRKTIEDLTECHICVYGKTVSIIGQIEMVGLARKAVESLLKGSPHSNVYKFLERQRRKLRLMDLEGKKQLM
jgi:ribosomal RNA assembly protein